MKKILLIEDRIERLDKYIETTGFDIKTLDVLEQRESLDDVDLGEYLMIITHRSAYGDNDQNILDFLKKHCEETNTKLVFFSGGISSTFYSKSKFEFLLLNSQAFYSDNLQLFLNDAVKNEEPNLLLLGYGENWKINIILNTLEKINLFISDNEGKEIIKFNNFKTVTKIENIERFIDFEYPVVIKGGVPLNEIRALSTTITNNLTQRIEHYV